MRCRYFRRARGCGTEGSIRISEADAARFRGRRKELGLGPLVVHSNYLINLASPNPRAANPVGTGISSRNCEGHGAWRGLPGAASGELHGRDCGERDFGDCVGPRQAARGAGPAICKFFLKTPRDTEVRSARNCGIENDSSTLAGIKSGSLRRHGSPFRDGLGYSDLRRAEAALSEIDRRSGCIACWWCM